MAVQIRRAYEEPQPGDGRRILVDRIWPRGRSRADLRLDAWLKEVAPSHELRRWFGHEAERWPEFRRRYRAELARPEVEALLGDLESTARNGTLTLVYSAADRDHNQAVVLAELLAERIAAKR